MGTDMGQSCWVAVILECERAKGDGMLISCDGIWAKGDWILISGDVIGPKVMGY